MIPSEILTHSTDALARLLQQYKNSDNIKNIIEIYAEMVQELEPVFQDLLFKRLDVNTAEGEQLDQLGLILGETRSGRNDDEYRAAIVVRIGINTSEGIAEDIIALFKILTDSAHVHLINLSSAEMDLEGTSSFADQDEINKLFNDLKQVRAGGTRINEVRCVDETDAFSFAGQGADSLGWGDGEFSTPYRFALPFAFAQDTGDSNDPSTEGFGAGSLDPLIGGEFVV